MKKVLIVLVLSLCLIGITSINSNSRELYKFYSNYEQGMKFNGENYKNQPYLYQAENNVVVVPYYSVYPMRMYWYR